MDFKTLEQPLRAGVKALDLNLSDTQINQLLAYLNLLYKWNKTYNLTAITDPKKMLTHHVLDSLSVIKYLENKNPENKLTKIIDIGTGAGIPGLILAIAYSDSCPGKFFSLLDSNGKKTRFLTQVIYELDLKNCEVLNLRAEEAGENLNYKNQFNIIISRAFSSLTDMFLACQNLLIKPSDTPSPNFFLAMKGKYLETDLEITELKNLNNKNIKINNIEKILIQVPGIPGIQEERCLVKFN